MRLFSHYVVLFWIPFSMAARLGGTTPNLAFRFSMLSAAYAVLISIARKQRTAKKIRIIFNGKTLPVTLQSSTDFALVREVFLQEEYRHETIPGAKVLFDVGANVGVASLYFHALYPDATIHAFEANPEVCALLKERVSSIPHIVPHCLALSDQDGTASFYVSSSPLASSLQERSSTDKKVTVTTRTVASMADELKVTIDLLKFDIEGGEARLFSDADSRTRARYLIGEVHADLMGMSTEAFVSLFPEYETTLSAPIAPHRYIFSACRLRG